MTEIIVLWFIYSFLGWITETLYTSIPKKKFQDRGFLTIPIIPIYGFGALIVIYLLQPVSDHPLVIFPAAIVATSLLEYVTSYIMERLFNMRWWDYSQRKYNIKGRVCLRNSLLFGLLSIALVNYIHPLVKTLIAPLSQRQLELGSLVIITIVSIDTVHAVLFSLRFSKLAVELARIRESLSEREVSLPDLEERRIRLRKRIEGLEHRLLYKYPILRNRLLDSLEELRETIKEKTRII